MRLRGNHDCSPACLSLRGVFMGKILELRVKSLPERGMIMIFFRIWWFWSQVSKMFRQLVSSSMAVAHTRKSVAVNLSFTGLIAGNFCSAIVTKRINWFSNAGRAVCAIIRTLSAGSSRHLEFAADILKSRISASRNPTKKNMGKKRKLLNKTGSVQCTTRMYTLFLYSRSSYPHSSHLAISSSWSLRVNTRVLQQIDAAAVPGLWPNVKSHTNGLNHINWRFEHGRLHTGHIESPGKSKTGCGIGVISNLSHNGSHASLSHVSRAILCYLMYTVFYKALPLCIQKFSCYLMHSHA